MKKRVLSHASNKISSKDFDLTFRRHPSSGKLLMKKGDDCVKQALKNLILTNKYERPFRPEFGGDVRKRLFDLFDTVSSADFESEIRTAIINYEPRVILGGHPVSVAENREDNSLSITIKYRNAITLTDVSLDVNLNRVR
jgi:phage baseplate assembly protein W